MIKQAELLPSGNHRRVLVSGDTIQEILNYMAGRIRPQSIEMYEKEIERDLKGQGHSLVDYHAGHGILYILVKASHYRALHRVGGYNLKRAKKRIRK